MFDFVGEIEMNAHKMPKQWCKYLPHRVLRITGDACKLPGN